jgi:hypothetical protein
MEYIEQQITIVKRFYCDPKKTKFLLENPDNLEDNKGYFFSEIVKKDVFYVQGNTENTSSILEHATLLDILNTVLGYYKISKRAILSPNRKQEIVRAKAMYSFVAKELKFHEKDISRYLNIGRITVYHHYKKYKNFIKYDGGLKREINNVIKCLEDEVNNRMHRQTGTDG